MSEWVEVSSAYDKDGAKDGTVDRVWDPPAQFVRKYLQALQPTLRSVNHGCAPQPQYLPFLTLGIQHENGPIKIFPA